MKLFSFAVTTDLKIVSGFELGESKENVVGKLYLKYKDGEGGVPNIVVCECPQTILDYIKNLDNKIMEKE